MRSINFKVIGLTRPGLVLIWTRNVRIPRSSWMGYGRSTHSGWLCHVVWEYRDSVWVGGYREWRVLLLSKSRLTHTMHLPSDLCASICNGEDQSLAGYKWRPLQCATQWPESYQQFTYISEVWVGTCKNNYSKPSLNRPTTRAILNGPFREVTGYSNFLKIPKLTDHGNDFKCFN